MFKNHFQNFFIGGDSSSKQLFYIFTSGYWSWTKHFATYLGGRRYVTAIF